MTSNLENYNNLISLIRNFCGMIDQIETYPKGHLVPDLSRALLLLCQEMEHLEVERDSHFIAVPDLDFRFEMFCRLLEVLATHIDNENPKIWEALVGSLADDLTDLYFELQRGLDLLAMNPSNPFPAVSLWRTGYDLHWREHLESALRQLTKFDSGRFN